MTRQLKPNQIFVFGSNLKGIHGSGSAKFAKDHYGAQLGVGLGYTGQCYALPTKRSPTEFMPYEHLAEYVETFLLAAGCSPEFEFLLTAVGTGLSRFSRREVSQLFINAPENVKFIDDNGNILYPAREWHQHEIAS